MSNKVKILNLTQISIIDYIDKVQSKITKVDKNPIYQRGLNRWNSVKKRNFIKNLLEYRMLPSPIIWTKSSKEYDYEFEIFDGKQRTQCLEEFLDGKEDIFDTTRKILTTKENKDIISNINISLMLTEYSTEESKIDHFISINDNVSKMKTVDIIFSRRGNYKGLEIIENKYDTVPDYWRKNDVKKKEYVTNAITYSFSEKAKAPAKAVEDYIHTLKMTKEFDSIKSRINRIRDLVSLFYDNYKIVNPDGEMLKNCLNTSHGAMFIGRLLNRNDGEPNLDINKNAIIEAFERFIELSNKVRSKDKSGGHAHTYFHCADQAIKETNIPEYNKIAVSTKIRNEIVKGTKGKQVGHIVPRSLGGTNEETNLFPQDPHENMSNQANLHT